MFIYTFWEPRTSIPYYLQLCMDTWKKFLPNATIVVFDYKNIGEFIDVRELGLNLFSGRFSLPMIADAIRVALLAKYGGVWMDVDTIILNSSAEKYFLPDENYKTIFFGHHIAFINTPPGAMCMKLWVNYIREKIWGLTPATKIEWSFMGNDFISAYINAHPDEMKILDANIHKPEVKIINESLKKLYPVNPYLGPTSNITSSRIITWRILTPTSSFCTIRGRPPLTNSGRRKKYCVVIARCRTFSRKLWGLDCSRPPNGLVLMSWLRNKL